MHYTCTVSLVHLYLSLVTKYSFDTKIDSSISSLHVLNICRGWNQVKDRINGCMNIVHVFEDNPV